MNKVIKKQQAAQTCNSLESLTKQDISDPTSSYSVSLTNILLVALSSLHGVYAQLQIQINNNPIAPKIAVAALNGGPLGVARIDCVLVFFISAAREIAVAPTVDNSSPEEHAR
jgi:hypothetical protein